MIPDTVFTLEDAKAQLRVVHAEDDARITKCLDAAVAACERITRRAWTARMWTTLVDACDTAGCSCADPAVWHALLSPATVVITADGPPPAPIADFFYSVQFGHTVVKVRTWPTGGEGIVGTITWTAAPPNGEVPPDVYEAAMLYLADFYDNRELHGVPSNPQAAALLAPYVLEMHV